MRAEVIKRPFLSRQLAEQSRKNGIDQRGFAGAVLANKGD